MTVDQLNDKIDGLNVTLVLLKDKLVVLQTFIENFKRDKLFPKESVFSMKKKLIENITMTTKKIEGFTTKVNKLIKESTKSVE